MARKSRIPGEKPLFWVGSSRVDLLDFPGSVKDGIGIALVWPSFAESIRTQNRGRAKAQEFLRLWKTSVATRFELFTQFASNKPCMCCTLFRKNHDVVPKQLTQILS